MWISFPCHFTREQFSLNTVRPSVRSFHFLLLCQLAISACATSVLPSCCFLGQYLLLFLPPDLTVRALASVCLSVKGEEGEMQPTAHPPPMDSALGAASGLMLGGRGRCFPGF